MLVDIGFRQEKKVKNSSVFSYFCFVIKWESWFFLNDSVSGLRELFDFVIYYYSEAGIRRQNNIDCFQENKKPKASIQ